MRNFIMLSVMLFPNPTSADEQSVESAQLITDLYVESSENEYIFKGNYLQNPYVGMPSSGGTKNISKSNYLQDSIAQKWFNDGTWNIFGAASYINQNNYNNYGNAVNLFAQTGQVVGFSFGGLFTIANPFFSNQWNPAQLENQAQGLSVVKQITPQELFIEYQYSNILQADVGWIEISNSPWMTYYQNNALNMVTYQGILVNVSPKSGWLLTGFAINGAQLLGETGFSQQTMYNSTWSSGTSTENIGNQGSPSSYAIGASYTSPAQLFNARLWGYGFTNYANMAYADTSLKLPINDKLGFTVGIQGLLQEQNSQGNILNNNGYGNSVSSNMLGAQLGFSYSIFGLQLSYNNIWGATDGYEAGGLISPYTYQYATDPLYTTGWIQGMVERSSGQAYKAAFSLNLLKDNLIITPSYQYYATTLIPATSEYDLQISYTVPQIKGLTFFGGYGCLSNADQNGNGAFEAQLVVSYLY